MKGLRKDRIVTFYLLHNNLFYSQVTSSYVLNNIDVFFLSSLVKLSRTFFRLLSFSFYLFLLQKDINIFHVLPSVVFLYVSDNNYLPVLYIQKVL